MAIQLVNVGTVANDGTGDPLRNAYIKLNANDSELYSLLDREIKTIVKNAHGFVSGNVLYLDNSGIFQKITTPSTQIPIGIVQTVIDANTFQLVEGGYVTSLSGLTAGTVYYVQTTGLLGTTVTSLKYLVADSITSGYILSSAGGVSSVTGTANQITSSPTTGAVVLTLPNLVQFPGTWTEGTLNYSDTGILWSAQSSVNSYNQVIVQNTSNGATDSANYIVSNDQGTATTFFGEFGINSSGFTGSMVFQKPNYVYLDSTSADLAIGTTTNNAIHFVVNGGTTDALTISGAGAISIPAFSTNNLIKTTGLTGTLALAVAGTDYLAPNGSGAALTDVWLLASGGTLSGPNVVTGTTTNTFKMVFNNLNTTQTDGAGIYLQNPQAAALGAQQISPSITWEGNAFATTPGSTMVVKYIADVLPVQGSSTVSALWRLRSSLNGAAYADALTINPSGVLTLVTTGFGSLILSSNLISTNQTTLTFQTQSTNRLVINNGGGITHTQAAVSGGAATFVSTPGTHTGIASNTEAISRDFQGATQAWNDGTVATQRFNYFRGYILNKTTTSATFTKAYNVYIDPLTLGTGVTGTSYALGINGNIELIANNSDLRFSGSGTSLTFLQGGTIQTSGGSSLNINAGSAAITSTSNGWIITQTISAATPVLKIVPFAATNLTASAEFVAVDFQNATQTWATGTLTTQRWNYFRGYTAAFVASSTLTNAYTVFIDPPVQGTNATLTNRWSLGLNGALQLFAGTTIMPPLVFQSGTNSSTIINGAVEFDGTHFYGAISGSRVQLDNQVAANGWLANGATTITGNTSQSGAFTETMSFNNVSMNQNVLTGNIIEALIVQTANHTNISTASFDFNSSLSVNPTPKTIQFNASISPLGSVSSTLLRPTGTFSFTSAGTIADVSNVFISSNQSAGTNATFTNSHGLRVTGPAHTGTGTVTNSYGLTVTAGSGAASNFSAQFSGGIGLKFTQTSQSATHNFLDITQSAHTGGNPFGINYVAGAHTGIGTSSPNPDIRFNLTRTVQFTGTATIATTDAFLITQPIYSFASAGGIITNASTLHIQGPPYGGTNTTITNAHGIYVDPLALSNVTNGYGSTINAPSGATNNYAAQFLGGNVGFRTSAPVSYLEIAGSYGDAITTLSANTTLDATHAAVLVDATGAARTITLPAASGATRRIYRIVKKDSSANTVTINTTAGGNKVISTQYAGFCVQSDGTSWFIVGAF